MTIEQWMRLNPDLVYEVLSELALYCLTARMEDDMELGQYVRQNIEERYVYEMSAQTIERPMIDTDRADDARGINRETRGIYGA